MAAGLGHVGEVAFETDDGDDGVGEAEDGLDGGFPDADDTPFAHDAEGPAVFRQGGRFV